MSSKIIKTMLIFTGGFLAGTEVGKIMFACGYSLILSRASSGNEDAAKVVIKSIKLGDKIRKNFNC